MRADETITGGSPYGRRRSAGGMLRQPTERLGGARHQGELIAKRRQNLRLIQPISPRAWAAVRDATDAANHLRDTVMNPQTRFCLLLDDAHRASFIISA